MVSVKRLTIQGFKSFGKFTHVDFPPGFTAIVGPNGSGKSNVIDSLCFVLGRTSVKSLRADRLTELIFNGGQDGRPAARAEVGIKFDNSAGELPVDSKEVEVTREVHKDGKSVYRINGKRSTRAQIADMLSKARISASGHNIILQGDVARIVEMNGLQRREIIDEICGIAEYEDKKSRATRELEKVQGKIGEAMAVFRERKKFLDSYERDKDKALRYQEIQKKLTGYRAEIYQIKIKKGKKELELIKKDTTEYEGKRNGFESERTKGQEDVNGLQEKINQIDAKIAEGHQSKYGKEIQELRVAIGSLDEKKKLLLGQKESLEAQLEEAELGAEEIIGRQKGAKEELEGLKAERERINKGLNSAQAEVKKLRDKIMSGGKDVREKMSGLREAVEAKRESLHEVQKDVERVKEYIRVKEEERNGIDIEANKKEIETLEGERRAVEGQLAGLEGDVKSLEEKVAGTIGSIVEKEEELAKSDTEFGRLEGLRARLDAEYGAYKNKAGFARAVKEVADSGIAGIVGTVAELGEVPEKYESAITTAAGRRLQNVVVKDDTVAEKCIAYLKEKDVGRATFLPLNKVKGEAVKSPPEGSIDFAYNLVGHGKEYDAIFAYVFGRTIVAEDVAKARAIGIGKERIVTLEGDLMERGGAMTGGSKLRGVGFKSEGLEERLESTNGELGGLEKKRDWLRNSIGELRKQLDLDEPQLREKSRELERLGGSLEAVERKLEGINSLGGEGRLKEIEDNLGESRAELEKLAERENGARAGLEKEISELEKIEEEVGIKDVDKFNEDMEDKEGVVARLQEEKNEAGARFSALKAQLEGLVGKELEAGQKLITRVKGALEGIKGSEGELRKNLESSRKALGSLMEKEEEESGIKSLLGEKTSLSEKIEKARKGVQECYRKIADLERSNNELVARKASIETRMADLREEYPDFEGQTIEIKHGESELERLIGKFNKELTEIGSVNMLAIEAYDELKKDFDELVEKKAKLEGEKAAVEKFMEEIDEKKKDAFMTTFLEILDKFEKTYGRLDPGGEAHLILENPDSPFEAGMEIQVRPRGKELINIDALSGGEKTMTALAFIFAIQQYRPAPFYILDEVDAALDKMNSQMLGEMLSEYAKSGIAQFIIITHNDSVLEKADRLYGVTMTPRGSQLVGVEIGDLPAEKEKGEGAEAVAEGVLAEAESSPEENN